MKETKQEIEAMDSTGKIQHQRQRRRDTVSRNRNNHCSPQQPTRGQPTVPEGQHPTHADSTVRWRGATSNKNSSGSAQECQGRKQQSTTTYRNPRSDIEIPRTGDDPPKGNNKFVQADSHKAVATIGSAQPNPDGRSGDHHTTS
jgi:hypothetical protein